MTSCKHPFPALRIPSHSEQLLRAWMWTTEKSDTQGKPVSFLLALPPESIFAHGHMLQLASQGFPGGGRSRRAAAPAMLLTPLDSDDPFCPTYKISTNWIVPLNKDSYIMVFFNAFSRFGSPSISRK